MSLFTVVEGWFVKSTLADFCRLRHCRPVVGKGGGFLCGAERVRLGDSLDLDSHKDEVQVCQCTHQHTHTHSHTVTSTYTLSWVDEFVVAGCSSSSQQHCSSDLRPSVSARHWKTPTSATPHSLPFLLFSSLCIPISLFSFFPFQFLSPTLSSFSSLSLSLSLSLPLPLSLAPCVGLFHGAATHRKSLTS